MKEFLSSINITPEAVGLKDYFKQVDNEAPKTAVSFLRAIELLNTQGLVKEILAMVDRFEGDPLIVAAAQKSIAETVSIDDIPMLISKVNSTSDIPVKQVAILGLRQLENVKLADQFDNWSCSRHLDDLTRLEAALALADLGDRRALSSLLHLMIDGDSINVRVRSKSALKKLTGQSFRYAAYDDLENRISQSEPWKAWIDSYGDTAALRFPLHDVSGHKSNLNGHTLIAISNKNTVVEFDEDMNEVWSFQCQYPISAEKMDNGNYLIAAWHENRVIEVTPKKEVVREIPGKCLHTAKELENGNLLISVGGDGAESKVFEINPNGETVWTLNCEGRWFADVHRLENGNTLVLLLSGQGYRLREINSNKNVISDIPLLRYSPNSVDAVQPLEGGNVLVSIINHVFEISKVTGDVVWQLRDCDARDAIRLKNGNTMILTEERVFEVDKHGIELWSKSGMSYGSVRR